MLVHQRVPLILLLCKPAFPAIPPAWSPFRGVPPQDTHHVGFRPLGEAMEHQMFSWEDMMEMLSIDILHGDPHDWWNHEYHLGIFLCQSQLGWSELMIFMVHARDRHQPSNASRSPTLSALASHHFNKYWNRQFYTLNSLSVNKPSNHIQRTFRDFSALLGPWRRSPGNAVNQMNWAKRNQLVEVPSGKLT